LRIWGVGVASWPCRRAGRSRPRSRARVKVPRATPAHETRPRCARAPASRCRACDLPARVEVPRSPAPTKRDRATRTKRDRALPARPRQGAARERPRFTFTSSARFTFTSNAVLNTCSTFRDFGARLDAQSALCYSRPQREAGANGDRGRGERRPGRRYHNATRRARGQNGLFSGTAYAIATGVP